MTRLSLKIAVVAGLVALGTVPALVKSESDGLCSDGTPGVESGPTFDKRSLEDVTVCCESTCAACDVGSDCKGLEGFEGCCTGPILEAANRCSAFDVAPCVVPQLVPVTCPDGGFADMDESVCCPLECGQCGGKGCKSNGGVDCCAGPIRDSYGSCDHNEAPCVL